MKMKEKQHYQYKGNSSSTRQIPNQEAQLSAWRKRSENGRRQRRASHRLVKKRDAHLARGLDCGQCRFSKHEGEGQHVLGTEPLNREMKLELSDSTVSDAKIQQKISFPNSSSAEEGQNREESNSTAERASLVDGEMCENKVFKAAWMKRKKSRHIRRQSLGRNLRQAGEKVYSPQREVRIRVLDDMKKTKMKSKRERKADDRTIFDSFAVIKTSTNPCQDFRDSMVEMINEKGIKQPEELEELLASYLTLNQDGHHELIINVFLEVCFELKTDPAKKSGQFIDEFV
ncbi:transcription repressor OFP5-like [Andrographis paniculata]|uniref:transcription repressor OFP5-like n=1 Tax=Andrographis paniculata TaxID=175694 RepID=UPI0021E7B654|nr:transcription repressor OFP5-like [Andrographis paniculata]